MGRLTLLFASLTIVALSASALGGCSDEATSQDRKSVPSGSTDSGVAADAGLTEAGVDPNAGRDKEPASCFAACSNSAFICQTKPDATLSQADLIGDATGCSGTLKRGEGGPVALKLDCPQAKVCVGGAPGTTPTDCFDATFSAITYAYTAAGSGQTVCTRD